MKAQSSVGRIPAYDFVRVTACIGVFCFHADNAVAALFQNKQMIHLPDWTGFLFVTVFFMLSGSMLELRYGESTERPGKNTGDETSEKCRGINRWNIKQYYRKRWINIYPAFYVVFIPLYLLAAAKRHSFFYQGARWTLLLSALGLDGYFSATFKTYYLVGEWFLGALILLYVLYPVLRILMKKAWPVLLTGSILLFLFVADKRLFAISPLANLPSCMISFVCGMFFERFVRRDKKRFLALWLFIAGLASLSIGFYRTTSMTYDTGNIHLSVSIPLHLTGMLLFLLLFQIGLSAQKMAHIFSVAAAYTYAFYLVHHVILDRIMRSLASLAYNKNTIFQNIWIIWAVWIIAFILSSFSALLVQWVAGYRLNHI